MTATAGTTTYKAYGVGTGEDSGILVTGIEPCTPSATVVCSAAERATVSVTGLSPSTQLTKTASAVITYTFAENNNGDTPLTNVTVSDPNCDALRPSRVATPQPRRSRSGRDVDLYLHQDTLTGAIGDTGSASVTNTATATVRTRRPQHHRMRGSAAPPTNTICKNEKDSVKVEITNNARSGG